MNTQRQETKEIATKCDCCAHFSGFTLPQATTTTTGEAAETITGFVKARVFYILDNKAEIVFEHPIHGRAQHSLALSELPKSTMVGDRITLKLELDKDQNTLAISPLKESLEKGTEKLTISFEKLK